MADYVVVAIPTGSTEYEQVHPGHMSQSDARQLLAAPRAMGATAEMHTQLAWEEMQDAANEELFCKHGLFWEDCAECTGVDDPE